MSLLDIFSEISNSRIRYLVIALAILVPVTLWAFLARPVYRSQATIAIESGRGALPSGASALGGLASLAGLSLGGAQAHREETIATLKARATSVDFISDAGIAPVLMGARWDPKTHSWRPRSGSQPVDAAHAYEIWKRKVLEITQNHQTGLVTVAVEWYEPKTAATWDSQFLRFTDSRLRDQALRQAEASIAFLNTQLRVSQDVYMQHSISDLLEQQLKAEMLAKVRNWYALDVVDPPAVPLRKFKPSRALVIALGAILSCIAVILAAMARHMLRSGGDLRVPAVRTPELVAQYDT